MRVRLDVSYDGTDFSGWAVQPGRRTVQADLQAALAAVLRLPAVALTVAGRTDAGVHALGQVAHADLPMRVWSTHASGLLRSVNGVLPPDVRVRTVSPAPAGFDARFSALWRRYVYRISDDPAGVDPLRRRFVVAWRRRLDEAAMHDAAQQLIGLHDFAAFCRHREGATSVRSLQVLDVTRVTAGSDESEFLAEAAPGRAGEIVCTVQADAFCHSMVRSLVGALIAVGEGRRAADWPAGLLARERRADDVAVVPPHGLTLVSVGYPSEDRMAERADQTRAIRAPINRG